VNLHTFMAKLSTLDPAETWEYDQARDCWATASVQSAKTKKLPRNHVLTEATPQHPAQVQVYTEDVKVGTWTTVKLSGALPAKRVRELTARVEKLQEAVKMAREGANSTEDVIDKHVGEVVFEYLLA
jgi:hypothetical protein